MTEHFDGDGDDEDHLCDNGCGQVADDGCSDEDGDFVCDECGAELSKPDEDVSDGDGAEKASLGTGAILGIAAGAAAVLALGGFAVVWFVIKKKSFADLLSILNK